MAGTRMDFRLSLTLVVMAAGPGCLYADRSAAPNLDCAGGACTCVAAWGDCDGKLDNGCETSLLNEPAHCGACNHGCASGVCAGLHCSCSANTADCDGDPANDCETSLQTDPESCGACGHDCLGGLCQEGACQPSVVWRPTEPGNPLVENLAVGATHLFWWGYVQEIPSGTYSLWSAQHDGVAAQNMWTAALPPQPNMVAAGTTAYWLGSGSVVGTLALWAYGLGGGAQEVVTIDGASAESGAVLALGGDALFVASPSPDGTVCQIHEVAVGTSEAFLVAEQATLGHCNAPQLAASADWVVWTDMGGLAALERSSGQTLVASDLPAGIVADGAPAVHADYAYFGVNGDDGLAIGRATLPFGDYELIATLSQHAMALLADGSGIYFVEGQQSPSLQVVPLAGGEPRVLAIGDQELRSLALTEDAVYWISGMERIMRVAK